ncbi:MAG: tupC [Bacillales bacterium]|jgi:tungstate transport system ATP-binding protein|nr:tupC [Bacillales bacterium]
MVNEIIKLNCISYERNNKKIIAIDNLSFDRGAIYGLIGPNGAGKSTLIKVASLLDSPTTGEINFDGQIITNNKIPLELRRKISVVFQQPLMLSDSVYNNISVSLKLRGYSRFEIRHKTEYWMEQFGISHLSNRNAKNLSGGEAQRVSLARAFVTDPEILFLDEPFSALDLPTKRVLIKDIEKVLSTTNITTILVSHDYNEIKYLCNKVVLLVDGKINSVTDIQNLKYQQFTGEVADFMNEWMSPL